MPPLYRRSQILFLSFLCVGLGILGGGVGSDRVYAKDVSRRAPHKGMKKKCLSKRDLDALAERMEKENERLAADCLAEKSLDFVQETHAFAIEEDPVKFPVGHVYQVGIKRFLVVALDEDAGPPGMSRTLRVIRNRQGMRVLVTWRLSEEIRSPLACGQPVKSPSGFKRALRPIVVELKTAGEYAGEVEVACRAMNLIPRWGDGA